MKAVVLAAGEGTRLRPLTFIRPKPLIPLGLEPSIYYLLSHLSREGFDDIIVVIGGPLKNQIVDYLGDGSKLGLRISYAVEPDRLRVGTAGCLKLSEHLLNETFLVAQADTLTEIPLREAVKFHEKKGALATIVLTKVKDPSNFGVAVLDEHDAITEFQEKPGEEEARSNLVSTGFYLMDPDSLDYIADERWDFAKDLFPSLLRLRKKISGFASDSVWVDIGNLEGYLRGVRWVLGKMLQSRLANTPSPGNIILGGNAQVGCDAQIAGPALIEEGARVGDGAKIQQYSVLRRNSQVSSGAVVDRSVIMERASVGRDSTVIDSVIGQSAVLQGEVTVEGSIVGPGCLIGDRVKIESGSRIWTNVKIEADQTVNGIVVAPLEKAFYFYTGFGQYTGLLATTLEGFQDALGKVPIESITFHAKRKDFERWTRDVLALNELADGIEDLRRTAVSGEELRSGLIAITKKWTDMILYHRKDA